MGAEVTVAGERPAGRLAGRGAVVTGAAGGIGRAIAARLAAEGAGVVVADIDMAGAAGTVAAIEEAGGRAVAMRCDVSAAADAEAATALAVERFGNLRVLVNNAVRMVPYGTVVELAEDDWNRAFAVNLTGAFLMSKHAVPAMAAAGGGSIIHIASQLGQVGKPRRAWYCVAKAGLIQLAKVMAIDHAGEGIRVNTISPGPVATERLYRIHGSREGAEAHNGPLTLFGRMGRPEEIGDAALFLASDESSFMTGADLLVDGGYMAL